MKFEFEGLEEFRKDMEELVSKYPDETSDFIQKQANTFTKDVNKKMPSEYSSGKRPLNKSWKKEKVFNRGAVSEIEIRNTAPHFHLIENGHEGFIPTGENGYIKEGRKKKKEGKASKKKDKTDMRSIGWVPGKFYCEKTRNEWQEKFPENCEEFYNRLLKEKKLI